MAVRSVIIQICADGYINVWKSLMFQIQDTVGRYVGLETNNTISFICVQFTNWKPIQMLKETFWAWLWMRSSRAVPSSSWMVSWSALQLLSDISYVCYAHVLNILFSLFLFKHGIMIFSSLLRCIPSRWYSNRKTLPKSWRQRRSYLIWFPATITKTIGLAQSLTPLNHIWKPYREGPG